MQVGEKQNRFGFTIIEMLVALSGFALVSVGIVALLTNLITEGNRQQGLLFDTDSARRVSFTLMQELRNTVISNTGAYPLESAAAQSVIFYSNIDGGSDIERVRYYISGTELRKGVVKPTGSPYTYNLGNETTYVVQRNVANGAGALFTYYDGSFAGSGSALTQPVNATSVRHVKMDLKISKPGKISSPSFTFSASVTPRNLKDNLGD